VHHFSKEHIVTFLSKLYVQPVLGFQRVPAWCVTAHGVVLAVSLQKLYCAEILVRLLCTNTQ
jgi:hypothetical protein